MVPLSTATSLLRPSLGCSRNVTYRAAGGWYPPAAFCLGTVNGLMPICLLSGESIFNR